MLILIKVYKIRIDNTITLTNVNKCRNMLNLSTFKTLKLSTLTNVEITTINNVSNANIDKCLHESC